MQSPLEKNVLLFPELWILSGTGPYGWYKSRCGVTPHELRHRIHSCHPPNLPDKPANFPITCGAIRYRRAKWETRGEEGPVHANYLIKPEMCLPCLLLHWFSVVSLERAVTPVLLASQGLHRISHVLFILPTPTPQPPSFLSPPAGKQTGLSASQLHCCWYYPAVCLPAEPPPAPVWVEGAAPGRDTAKSSFVFISLWFSVKCRAGSDTIAENCLPFAPTAHLSALIVRLTEWVYRNCLCSVPFKVSERWRRRAVNHILKCTNHLGGYPDELFGEGCNSW